MKAADLRIPVLGAVVAAAALLGGCVASAPPRVVPAALQEAAAPGSAGRCRVGADGGPLPGTRTVADRGIGGTGAPVRALMTTDRGIGGTGIIGVITGFASICLGGQEVGYDPALPVILDGAPGGTGDLRAGQFALVEAAGPDAGLQARRVMIRHEVAGPVEAVETPADAPRGTRMLRVAGQRVAVAGSTLGDVGAPLGAWVAVSGLRDTDGVIHATRLDPVEPGLVRIAGRLLLENGRLRIGTAEIRPASGLVLRSGENVVVAGRYRDGVLLVESASPDFLPGNPEGYFGAAVQVVVVESFAGLFDGRLVLGRAQRRGAGQPFQRSVVELQRDGGALLAGAAHAIGPGAAGPGAGGPVAAGQGRGMAASGASRLEPAPLPFRGTGGGYGGPRSGSLPGRMGDGRGMDRPRGGNDPDQGPANPGFGGPAAAPFGGPAGGFGGGPVRSGR